MLAAALLSAVVLASGAQAVINSPTSLITCEPTLLSWDASTSPYYLSVIPGGEPSASALETLGTFTTTSYTWDVNLAAGTSVTISLKDGTGAQFYTGQVTITAGSDTSCVGQSVNSTSSSTAAESSGASSAVAASSAVSATSAAVTAAGSSAATSATSATAATSSAVKSASSAAASGTSKAASVASAAAGSASAAATSAASSSATSSMVLSGSALLGALSLGVYALL